jgi:hypothetical protein
MEQGNQIQRCNKLARNHSAFASFEFLDSTPSPYIGTPSLRVLTEL